MPTAVITGGASGFGLALGGRCAALGMDVALLDLDGERASSEARRITEGHGLQAIGVGVDVSDGVSVERAASTVQERLGGVDLVVSNVGVQLFGPVERFTDDEWRWVLDVNVTGSARVARSFIPATPSRSPASRRAGSRVLSVVAMPHRSPSSSKPVSARERKRFASAMSPVCLAS